MVPALAQAPDQQLTPLRHGSCVDQVDVPPVQLITGCAGEEPEVWRLRPCVLPTTHCTVCAGAAPSMATSMPKTRLQTKSMLGTTLAAT